MVHATLNAEQLAERDPEALIKENLELAETGIRCHPPEVVAVYEFGMKAFHDGVAGTAHLEEDPDVQSAATLAAHYSMATAFVSAWYHLHGDKANRDKAAQSAAMALGLLGVDSGVAFQKILEYEQLWRSSLRAAGIGTSSSLAPVIAFLVIGAVVWVLWKVFA